MEGEKGCFTGKRRRGGGNQMRGAKKRENILDDISYIDMKFAP